MAMVLPGPGYASLQGYIQVMIAHFSPALTKSVYGAALPNRSSTGSTDAPASPGGGGDWSKNNSRRGTIPLWRRDVGLSGVTPRSRRPLSHYVRSSGAHSLLAAIANES